MKRSILATAVLALGLCGQAAAAPCGTYIDRMFTGFPGDHAPAHWFHVEANLIAARNMSGFSAFAMDPSYATSQGISNPATAYKSGLYVSKPYNTASYMQGQFRAVFPGRSDGSTDLTTLRIFRSGSVQMILNAWGNSTVNLSDLQCFPGHVSNTFVLIGQERSAGYGLTTWTMVLSPGWLL